MFGQQTNILAQDILVESIQPYLGRPGLGVELALGAQASFDGLTVRDTQGVGIIAVGAETELALSDLVVTDTKLDPEGDAGIGLRIRDGAKLALSRGFIGSNYKAGLVIQEALTDALIEDLVIRDTATRADGSWGRGLNIESGAEVTGQQVLLANNHEFGMYIGNEDTKVTLSNVTVLGTNPSASDGVGDGVRVEDGASATFDKLKVEGNAGLDSPRPLELMYRFEMRPWAKTTQPSLLEWAW